jgi:hypothetical protein
MMHTWRTVSELVNSATAEHKSRARNPVGMPHACVEESSSASTFHSKDAGEQAIGAVLIALTTVLLSAWGGHNHAAGGSSTTGMSPVKVICGGEPALTASLRSNAGLAAALGVQRRA